MSFAATSSLSTACRLVFVPVRCSDSNPKRGFGANSDNSNNLKKTNKGKRDVSPKEKKGLALEQRKSTALRSRDDPAKAPGLNSQFGGTLVPDNASTDSDFEERLKAVKLAAIEQKKTEEVKELGAIDYDAPIESDKKTIGLGTKIGVGVAVAVFGLVFALGDFLPSGSVGPSGETAVIDNQLSEKEKTALQAQLKEFEATLGNSPKDPTALEGAAVTLAELGEYKRSASLLEELTKEKPNDHDAYRLLGEVKYKLKDFEGSANAFKTSATVSKYLDSDVLRGCTNSLLAAKKPDEAVQFLLASRERISKETSDASRESSRGETETQKVDPVQVDLLLGKAYSDWGHVSDAVSVYDQLISSRPNDFRGYLAKGIILKENGSVGDAERMFIQARFFAPEKAKALVDRYAGR